MSVDINGNEVVSDVPDIDWSRLKNVPAGANTTGDVTAVGISNCAANGMYLTVANCSGTVTLGLKGGVANCQNCANCWSGNCTNCAANCSNCTNCTTNCASCFVAGTLVRMADGSDKNIEDVVVGDVVLTSHGEDTVKQLWRPILGPRPLIQMKDGTARVSSDHPLWSRDPVSHQQFWCTRDMDEWLWDVNYGIGSWFGDDALPFDLSGKPNRSWEYATLDGFKTMTWEFVPADPETQLYHLILENHGSYFADGYLAVTQGDKCGVDWTQFEWHGHPARKSAPVKLSA